MYAIVQLTQRSIHGARHPLDQTNTSTVRSIPGLEMIARSFLGPAAEQVLMLENIASSIKVGPDQLPSIHKLIVEAGEVAQTWTRPSTLGRWVINTDTWSSHRSTHPSNGPPRALRSPEPRPQCLYPGHSRPSALYRHPHVSIIKHLGLHPNLESNLLT